MSGLPRVPTEYSQQVVNDIGLGQGNPQGTLPANHSNHLTGKIYERVGDEEVEGYGNMFTELEGLRGENPNARLEDVIDALAALPVGLRLTADVRGFSIGELVERLSVVYSPEFLRGLYLYARVRDLHLTAITKEDMGMRDGSSSAASGSVRNTMQEISFNSYIQDTRVRHVPLWKVLSVLPVYHDGPGGRRRFFTGESLEKHMDGLKRLFLDKLLLGDSLPSELLGSDVASFFILEDVTIVRESRTPEYMDRRISPIRTAGFGELLLSSSIYSFTVGELLDSVKVEIAKHKIKKTPGWIKKNEKDLVEMLYTTVFTNESLSEEISLALVDSYSTPNQVKNGSHVLLNSSLPPQATKGQIEAYTLEILRKCQFSLVVPGGVGCCVDNCVSELVTLAVKTYPELSHREISVSQARAAAKERYVEGRLKLHQKRTGGKSVGVGNVNMSKKYKAEFEAHSKNGYSPHFFHLFKENMRLLYNVNPRIFYERSETRGKTQNPNLKRKTPPSSGDSDTTEPITQAKSRKRLVEVAIELKTSPEIDENPTSYKEVNSGGGGGGYLNQSMFRINLNGEIHKHYPKSAYVEKGANMPYNFICDESEGDSGILHAIGIFPYIPMALLKKNFLLPALFNLIEKRTIPLMEERRSLAYGSISTTDKDLQDLVRYQQLRHVDGVTKTLIYDGGKGSNPLDIPTSSTNDSQGSNILEVEQRNRDEFRRAQIHQKEKRDFADKTLIVAYDIESVEMTPECLEAGMVSERFLKYNPDKAKYKQIQKQIPYMVQWVPVNLCDEGDLLSRKLRNGVAPRQETPTATFKEANDWIQGRGWEEGKADAKKYLKGWIVLDSAKIEYGGFKLGECVEDFIQNVFTWAVRHSYDSVKCYAHNGASFDTLLVQAFNTRFQISKVLKVKGSLLNLRLKVPLGSSNGSGDGEGGSGGGKHMYINFGDTRKFLVGSLDRLCKDFKLPNIWSKLDFPITRINWKNCYHPQILKLVEPYALNDAYALAFIIKQINRMLCLHSSPICNPAYERVFSLDLEEQFMAARTVPLRGFAAYLDGLNIIKLKTMKPPIDQFCTIMSFVKRVLKEHVSGGSGEGNIALNLQPRYQPKAVDIPALRYWLDMALNGGRVSAYAKVYSSSRFGNILESWMAGNFDHSAHLIREAIKHLDAKRCLDITSLYPFIMQACSLPMGEIFWVGPAQCQEHIVSVGCKTCESRMTFCSEHRMPAKGALRPFTIVLVKNFKPSPTAKAGLINLVGRKVRPKTCKTTHGQNSRSDSFKKSDGLNYTLESDEEATWRLWGEYSGEEGAKRDHWNVHGKIQSYSNVDLYWALRCGFTFEIIAGFSWQTSGVLSDMCQGFFEMRAKAKASGNHTLQIALKNLLNGSYGVHCQKPINSVDKVITLPPDIYDCDIKDERVVQQIRDHHSKTFDSRFTLKESIPMATKQSYVSGKVASDLGETVGGLSPNHVGAAVLAWSRHLMNLTMFPLMSERGGAVSYTDTDSITVCEETYAWMVKEKSWLIDETGKTLGTYKNDHGDYFPNAVILFSALGGKKVKMHIIGCPSTGNLKICNTYKGYMTDPVDGDGRKYTADRAGYELSNALIDILYTGKPSPHTGTRWTRGMGEGGGVRIEKKVLFEPTTKAYLGHCQGFCVLPAPNTPTSVLRGGVSELFPQRWDSNEALLVGCVPHGSTHPIAFKPKMVNVTASGVDEIGQEIYTPCAPHLVMPDEWAHFLDETLDGEPGRSRVTRDSLRDFFGKYFSSKDGFYGEFSAPDPHSRENQEKEMSMEVRKALFEANYAEWTASTEILDKVDASIRANELLSEAEESHRREEITFRNLRESLAEYDDNLNLDDGGLCFDEGVFEEEVDLHTQDNFLMTGEDVDMREHMESFDLVCPSPTDFDEELEEMF